jgi:succinate-semialdehyde dehydrogenase / glutarate-semialdehyde dehydrogenase
MIAVRNPRTGKNDYTFKEPSSEAIQQIAKQLRQQQVQWFEQSVALRIEAMQRWKKAVQQLEKELIAALVEDTGRLWETELEVKIVSDSIDRWCSIAEKYFEPAAEQKSTNPFINTKPTAEPYELVGVISPWNFPLLLSLIDTIPALLAGCAVMVKPSEVTPRFIIVLQKSLELAKLSHVCAYIQGTGIAGAQLIEVCDSICFTGSTATGKKVYEAAAKKMIPVFLEMGGKDPAVVLEGADIDHAAASVLWGSTANAGQSCLSIERVYVQQTIYDVFVKKLCERAIQKKIAYPQITDGKVGPIIFEKQAQIINEHLRDAIEKGAAINCGNNQCHNMDGAFYCEPTVLTQVNHTMKIMEEESFGPLIPVMAFNTIEEGIALANKTVYGLSGAVFAANNDEAIQVAKQIKGGAISINDCALTAFMHEGEKQSFKLSGIGGTRMGPAAFKRFLRQKVFLIKNSNSPSPWW